MPRPSKFYAETDLHQPTTSPCGIENGNSSEQVVDISNLGGSHEEVYIAAASQDQKIEFVNSTIGNRFNICYAVPIKKGKSRSLPLQIEQESDNPGQGTDTIHIIVKYRAAQNNTKREVQSIPSAAHPVTQFSVTVTLDQ